MEGNQPCQAKIKKPQSSLGFHVSRKKSKNNALSKKPIEIDAAAVSPTQMEESFLLLVRTCLKLAPSLTKRKPTNNQTNDKKFCQKIEADCARNVKWKAINSSKDYEGFCDRM